MESPVASQYQADSSFACKYLNVCIYTELAETHQNPDNLFARCVFSLFISLYIQLHAYISIYNICLWFVALCSMPKRPHQ